MIPIRSLLFAAVVVSGLTACVTPADEQASVPPKPPHEVAPPAPPTPPGEEPIMKCDDSNTEWANGKLADEALVTRIRTETNSKSVRVIKPGMMVTMDYREDRVNIDVDATNHVTNVRCG
jgi:hypothetical protein